MNILCYVTSTICIGFLTEAINQKMAVITFHWYRVIPWLHDYNHCNYIVNLDLLKVLGKNDFKKSPQMVVLRWFNGDESHGRIRNKSSLNKQKYKNSGSFRYSQLLPSVWTPPKRMKCSHCHPSKPKPHRIFLCFFPRLPTLLKI